MLLLLLLWGSTTELGTVVPVLLFSRIAAAGGCSS
jgi:hypothetical protein